ncbi:UV radiation resistance protein and autophagy-related subunit 14-domain-containing protein [Cunninghamella echinulata]|nr:UV radiation resistance protein and autophagy-related subunit 14-domain-containing protein [Cunninghamella echinulata]
MHGGNQCRIRHIKAIVGRNIGWDSNSNIQEITEAPNLSSHTDTSNSPSPSTSTTIITPPTNNNITFTSADNHNNNSNSNNTASITKRFSNSFSKQNQYNNGNIDNAFCNPMTTTTPSHIHKLDTHHNLQLKDTNSNSQSHMMQRSDSTSSMQSCNSSVADSSLTKSAYKNNSKRLENKASTIFNISSNNNNNNNNNNNINMNDSYSVSTIDDDSPPKHEKELLDTYLTLSLPVLPHSNSNDIHDTNNDQKDNNDDHNESIDTENGDNNSNNSIHRDTYQTKKIKDTTFTNINVNNMLERPLYTSEIIPNSTNPLFRTDMSMIDWYDGVQTVVIAKIWAKHSIPESASLSKQMDPTRIQTSHLYSTTTHHEKSSSDNNNNHSYSLIVEWVVDMNELVFIGKSLKHAYSWPNNALLFKLDNGYYTSPDIASIALGQSKRPIYLDSNLDIDNASLHSIQSPRIKRSYTYHHIMKLNTLKDCIFDAKKAADEVQQNINDLLEQEKEKFKLLRLRSQKETRLKELENEIQEQRQNIKIGNRKIEDFKNTLERRRLELKRSQERFHREKEDLESNEVQLENNVKMHHDIFTKLNQRKKELIADLFSIYPIEQFRIRSIYLPNSVYTGCNEESIATALGFTAHLVNMMAFYLDIPLRYPIDPMGSRSLIHDPVSLINGSRVFPLYGKGVDKYRFEFGVFLLNKNIEQMMNAYGLIVMDLRHTLPNIHYFIQAVLTTSVTSGPTSLSVLSISSYAQGKDIFEGTATRIQPSRSIDLTSTIKKMNSSSSLANNKRNKDNGNNYHHNLQHNDKKYSNSSGYDHLKNDEEEEEHGENHLTLQPTIFIPTGPTPSPTISTQSVSISPKFGVSPGNGYPYTGVHLSSSVISVPAYLDTVTTSSCQKKPTSKT